MMRLIDGNALWERLNDEPWENNADRDDIALPIVNAASTVDAVAVTRCKNCRSYNKPKTGWCEVHLDCEHPDDFCSYGERKDGDNAI